MTKAGLTIEERLDLYTYYEPNTGCWLWGGYANKQGYGYMMVSGKLERVHKLSYETFVGEVPEGIYVRHTCSVNGCVNPDHIYLGTIENGAGEIEYLKRGATIAERLEAYSIPEPNSGCWLWFGRIDGGGYPVLKDGGKPLKAHRLSYMEHHGPIKDGLCVCHRCDTPACINPDHLFLGTHKDNMNDMARKGRARSWVTGKLHGR